jgi:hypothetical protein
VLIGADVGGLHDVLGLRIVASDGAGGAVEALVVAAHDDLKERGFAGEHAADDLFIAEGAGGSGDGPGSRDRGAPGVGNFGDRSFWHAMLLECVSAESRKGYRGKCLLSRGDGMSLLCNFCFLPV